MASSFFGLRRVRLAHVHAAVDVQRVACDVRGVF